MKCLNINDPLVKELLGSIKSEVILSKIIDKVGDNFSKEKVLSEFALMNKSDIHGTELLRVNEITKNTNNQNKFKEFVNSILTDVKNTTAQFLDRIMINNEKSDVPQIQAFIKIFKDIGYGAMLSNYKTMLLAQDRPVGTEYHEAFHAFEQNMFSKKELKALYYRVSKLTGESLSDDMASERLAEMYRIYAVNRKLSEKIESTEDKSFFTQLLDYFRNFFSNIHKLLEQDEKAVTKLNNISKKNNVKSLNTTFDEIYRGQVNRLSNTFNDTQTKEILNFMSLEYNKFLKSHAGDVVRYFNDEDYHKDRNTYILDGANVKNITDFIYGSPLVEVKYGTDINVGTIYDSIYERFGETNPDLIEKLIINYDDLITQHKAMISGKSEIQVEEEEQDESDRANEYADVTASEINEKLKIKDFLKVLMMSIPKRIGDDYITGELQLEQPIDFNTLHEQVHSLLAGMTDFDEMIQRLTQSENPDINKGLTEMINDIQNNSTNTLSKMLFENAFYDQYSKQDNNFISHIITDNNGGVIVDLREQQALANTAGNIKNEFAKMLTNSVGKSLEEKFYGLIPQLISEFSRIESLYGTSADNLSNKTYSLLDMLGLHIPSDIKSTIDIDTISKIYNELTEYRKYIKEDLGNFSNFTKYKKDGFVANSHVKQAVKELIPFLLHNTIFSMQNLDNKRQYSIQQWDFVNKAIDEYNKNLIDDFEKTGEDSNLAYIETMTHFKKNTAVKINKLNDKDLMIVNIINAKNSLIPYIFSGDKSTYMGIKQFVEYSDTVDNQDKLNLYRGIIKDEIEQYFKFKNNTYGVEPNYFAISQDFLSPTILESFKKIVTIEEFNEAIESLNSSQINSDIFTHVKSKENEMRAYLKELGINLKDVLVDDSTNSFATVEGLVQFFAEGFYKQTKHITGDLGFFKSGADFLKRAGGALGAKASLRVDAKYIEEFNNQMTSRNTQRFNTDGTFKSLVVDDVFSFNLEVAYDFLDDKKKQKARKLIDESKQTGIISDELKEMFEGVAYGFENGKGSINIADGQGYVHIDSLRFQLISESKWSFDLERFYQRDLKGITTKEENDDFTKAISTKKPQYFGWQKVGDVNDDTKVMTFYKTSIFPLTRTFGKTNPMVRDMMNTMLKNNINFTFIESANKIGRKKETIGDKKQGAVLFDDKGNINITINTDLLQTTYWKYWGTQVDVDDKIKSKQTIGTQMRKLIFGNLKQLLGDDRANSYWNRFNFIENKRIELEKEALEARITKTNENGIKVIDRQKLLDILEESIKSRNMSKDYVDEIRNLMTKDTGLDLATNRLKLESLMYSLVTNNIIKPKVDGTSQPQISSLGLTNTEFSVDNNNIIKQTTQGLEELKFYEVGSDKYGMEVYLPNYLRSSYPLGEIDSKLLEAIGFRIPTQGHNSIERIIIKGFLPENQGNAIIVPKEMTLKGGSDFDIDKLNIYLPAFYKDSKGKPTYIPSYEDSYTSRKHYQKYLNENKGRFKDDYSILFDAIIDDFNNNIDIDSLLDTISKPTNVKLLSFKDFIVKQINNSSIELYKDILNQPELRKVMLKPNSDSIIKAVSKDGDKSVRALYGNSNKIKYSNILTARQHIISKTSFLAGKFTLGSVSLHSTSHAVSQYSNLELVNANPIAFLNNNTTINLHRVKDEKDRWINNNIEEYQNASVDVAKDDYIKDINLTLNTGNTHMYLIRTGVPIEQVVYFMSQPILLEYSKLYNDNMSIDSGEGISSTEAHENALAVLKLKYGDNPVKFNMSEEALISQITNTNKDNQRYILDQFTNYYNDSKKLFELMNATAFDTKSVGSNQSENEIRMNSFNKVVKENKQNAEPNSGNSYFQTNIDDEFEGGQFGKIAGIFKYKENDANKDTFIKTMHDVVMNTNKYFNPLFKYNKSGSKYKSIIDSVKADMEYFPNDKKIKMTNRLVDDFITFVIQNMPITNLNRHYKYYTETTAKNIIELQQDKFNLLNKINDAKTLEIKEKLLNELSLNPLYNNVYLDTLNVSSVNGQFVIDYKNGTSFDTIRQEELHRSFDELYKIRPDLATNLVIHNLFQSGLSNSPSQLKNGIPNNYLFNIASNYYNFPKINYSDFRLRFLLNNHSEMLDYFDPNQRRKSYYKKEKSTGDVIITIENEGNFRIANEQLKSIDGKVDLEINGIYRKDYTINKINNDKPLYNTNSVNNKWFSEGNC